MSLQPKTIAPVPQQTRQVAQAAFPQGNRYMQLRDTLGTVYEDTLFADLFPQRGQPAHAPWQLALVTDGPDARMCFAIRLHHRSYAIRRKSFR